MNHAAMGATGLPTAESTPIIALVEEQLTLQLPGEQAMNNEVAKLIRQFQMEHSVRTAVLQRPPLAKHTDLGRLVFPMFHRE